MGMLLQGEAKPIISFGTFAITFGWIERPIRRPDVIGWTVQRRVFLLVSNRTHVTRAMGSEI